MVKFDIILDFVCLWCYIGKFYLDCVLEKVGDYFFVIEWYFFMLNFDMLFEGMNCGEYFEKKFGDCKCVVDMFVLLQEYVVIVGVIMNLEGQIYQLNIFDVYWLIYWVGLE